MPPVRLFCALMLPDEALDRLEDWQRRLPAGDFRPVPRPNLHVTLAFLGRRPAGELPAILRALDEAAAGTGRILFRPARYRETRGVGMVVLEDAEDAAARLAADLHARLAEIGVYEPERRHWLPHVTVVRFRRPPRLSPELPDLGAEVGPSGAAVYHSVLRPTGAQHEVIHSVALGG